MRTDSSKQSESLEIAADESQSADGVGVLHKSLSILEALVSADGAIGLSELSRAVALNKATTYRILSTFESRGFVARDKETRRYTLGKQLITIAAAIGGKSDLVQLARPLMEDLHREYGETVNLAVMLDTSIQYLLILEADRGLRMAARAGARDHICSTALGRAMLARIPPAEARRLMSKLDRPKLTANTITDINALMKVLQDVRRAGYAIDDEENEAGGRCVAVAVTDDEGAPVAALSISAPTARVPDQLIPLMGHSLQDAAERLSDLYRGGPTAS